MGRLWDGHEPEHGTGRARELREERARATRALSARHLLACGFFAVCTVVVIVFLATGAISTEAGLPFLLLGAGFLVMSGALLPSVRRGRTQQRGPNAAMWTFLLLGAGLWCAAPIVMLAHGYGWSSLLFEGGGRRNIPVWMLAALTWGLAAILLCTLVWQRQRQRQRRGRGRATSGLTERSDGTR